jgi:hypothetical protein
MKFFPDIEREHLIKSLFYLSLSIALMALSFFMGFMKGGTFGALMFWSGAALFFYALPHCSGKAKYYIIEFAVLFSIYAIMWIFGFKMGLLKEMNIQVNIDEDVAWFLGAIIFAAFIGSIAGVFIFSEGSQRLHYPAITLMLGALFLMFPQFLFHSPDIKPSVLTILWVFVILQFVILVAVFSIASMNKTGSRLSGITFIMAVILLIIMAIWGFFVKNDTHWMAGLRLWALLEFISALIILYAYANLTAAEP